MKLIEIFEDIPDFRRKTQVKHYLHSILVISLCAVISGADDFEEIAEYGAEKEDFLRQFVPLPNGIPSHDTFRRVFQNIDAGAFEKCLRERTGEVLKALEEYQVNIDGKVLRATGKRGKKTAAICIVSAWASEHCVSLGQVKTDKKGNEKTAIPELVEAIDVRGALVSIDAMGCDRKVAALIRSNGGDYLLALKKNQKGLYEEAQDWMGKHKAQMDVYSEVDYCGGRVERRTTYVCDDLTYIDESLKWADSKRVILVEAEREFKNGEGNPTLQTRFYISSRAENAEYFAGCTRKHWGIENQLHWHLDVVFNEDRQRLREGNGPENMAIVRKMALQTLMKSKGRKSLKTMRKKVAWNDSLLFEVLKNF
jgi:predicted transposase YbfD/YdcC